MTPTPIHVLGMLSKYAANASPTMRIKNPMMYDANEDMALKPSVEDAVPTKQGASREPDLRRDPQTNSLREHGTHDVIIHRH